MSPHLPPFDAAPLLSVETAYRLTSTGHGASVCLDVAPTLHILPLVPVITPLAVLDLLPRSFQAPVVPRHVPVVTVSLVRSPSLCLPRPVPRYLSDPRGYPVWESLPLLPPAPSHLLLPLSSSTSDPVPYRYQWFLVSFFVSTFSFLSALPSLLLRRFLVSSSVLCIIWVKFFAKARGQGASTP